LSPVALRPGTHETGRALAVGETDGFDRSVGGDLESAALDHSRDDDPRELVGSLRDENVGKVARTGRQIASR
jgi:hypothetical protein